MLFEMFPGTKWEHSYMFCQNSTEQNILHFKINKTIKYECILFPLEPFLESVEDVHVKYIFQNIT